MYFFIYSLLLSAMLVGCSPTETTLRPVSVETVRERQADMATVLPIGEKTVPVPQRKPGYEGGVAIKSAAIEQETRTLGDFMTVRKDTPFLNTAQRYRVTWAGLHVGDLIIGFRELGSNRCRMQTAIQAYGIVEKISQFKAETEAEMTCLEDGTVQPLTYNSSSRLRDRIRNISFEYDPQGMMRNYVIDPAESPGKRPEIPAKQLQNSYDGLTLAVAVRSHIRRAVERDGPKQFSLPLFDGRKLLNLHFTMIGLTTDRLIHVSMRTEPVAGYNEKDLRKYKERDMQIAIYVDPDTYLPVKARGYSSKGTAYAILEENCFSFEACLP